VVQARVEAAKDSSSAAVIDVTKFGIFKVRASERAGICVRQAGRLLLASGSQIQRCGEAGRARQRWSG